MAIAIRGGKKEKVKKERGGREEIGLLGVLHCADGEPGRRGGEEKGEVNKAFDE